ncbi:hypothetical protein [Paenibacillus sp. Soil724D2]|uniref:hypothetical protein n=1 Tax=Paenibacillus sp. (strain Soil724D2) TaxID=1736392 RepID=UPI000714B80D|nr:hypothetical protein [Paenibacillus sp. Soil724D2]KRE46354.1 hypothetical protein ASG85_29810 [Paenibacillus sp. Soil724D2]
MKKKLVLVITLALCVGTLGWEKYSAFAMSTETNTPKENTITLFENTTLLSDNGTTIGILAPQTVTILNTSQRRVGHGEGYLVPIYQIFTWVGKAWIMPFNAALGEQVPSQANLELFGVEPIYFDPGLTKPTWIQLAPQTVKIKSKWGDRYLIETQNGDRWIAPRYESLYGMEEVRREVQLQNETKLLRSPSGLETGAALSPQKVKVNEVWRDWYRTESWLGPVWFKLPEMDTAVGQSRFNDNHVSGRIRHMMGINLLKEELRLHADFIRDPLVVYCSSG